MMALRGLIGLLAGALLLVGCGSRETIRYKLTVVVETPQGVRTGSSVNEVIWGGASPIAKAVFGSLAGGSMDWRGEAVAVDLPAGQTLFVLLRSPASEEWAGWVSQDVPKNGMAGPVPRKDNMGNGNIPYFVRFKSIDDPKSVEQLDPDNLAKTFGPGYQLKALTLQATDEPVTTGIEKRLAWFETVASSGGNFIPMERVSINGRYRFRAKAGYDENLTQLGLSDLTTEAYK